MHQMSQLFSWPYLVINEELHHLLAARGRRIVQRGPPEGRLAVDIDLVVVGVLVAGLEQHLRKRHVTVLRRPVHPEQEAIQSARDWEKPLEWPDEKKTSVRPLRSSLDLQVEHVAARAVRRA